MWTKGGRSEQVCHGTRVRGTMVSGLLCATRGAARRAECLPGGCGCAAPQTGPRGEIRVEARVPVPKGCRPARAKTPRHELHY